MSMLNCPICDGEMYVDEKAARPGDQIFKVARCCTLVANGRNVFGTQNRWNKAVMEYRKMIALEKLANATAIDIFGEGVNTDERSSVAGAVEKQDYSEKNACINCGGIGTVPIVEKDGEDEVVCGVCNGEGYLND